MMETVVIDTDCGVDDAMALLLSLNCPSRMQVIGFTCCHGNTSLDNVVNNVKRVLVLSNRKEIPVYRGCKSALLSYKPRRKESAYHGADGFGGFSQDFSTGGIEESDIPAAVALTQLARQKPGVITLIAIGPLTNLAVAHRIDPDFTSRLKQIVIMGGNYKGQGNTTEVSEFNFHCDPESADIILGESQCPVSLVPWETCFEHGFDLIQYEQMCSVPTKKGAFYPKVTELLLERSRRRKRVCTDCDFLAVAAVAFPECVTASLDSPLTVECGGTHCRALTVLLNHEKSLPDHGRKNVRILTGFDKQYLNRLRLAFLRDEPVVA